MLIYMHKSMHTYIHTHLRAYILPFRHATWMHAFIHKYMHTFMHKCIHTSMHTCMVIFLNATLVPTPFEQINYMKLVYWPSIASSHCDAAYTKPQLSLLIHITFLASGKKYTEITNAISGGHALDMQCTCRVEGFGGPLQSSVCNIWKAIWVQNNKKQFF